jgi:hypothetical protein
MRDENRVDSCGGAIQRAYIHTRRIESVVIVGFSYTLSVYRLTNKQVILLYDYS